MDQSGIVSGISTGTTTIYYTLPSGCDVSKEITITNCTPPTITVTDDSRCGTGTVTLSASASSGTIYWYSSASSTTSIASGDSFTTPNISTSTTYYASVTDGVCSSSKKAVNAIIHSLPTISGTSTLYESEITTLSADQTAASTSPWTSADESIASINCNGVLTANKVGTASITYESVYGCTNSKNITVAAPSASISYASPFCDNNTSLQSVTLNGNGQYTGGTFSSSTGLTIDSHTGAINPSESNIGNYVVAYEFPYSGGTITANTSVQILASPEFSNLAVSCIDYQGIYTVNVELNSGTLSSDIGTISNSGINYIISDINISDNTTLTATNNTCTSSLNIAHPSCLTCPSMNAPTSNGNASFCEGSSIPTISAQVNSDEQVNWYDAEEGGNLLLANSSTYTPSSEGTYYAEAENSSTSCLSARTAILVEKVSIPTILSITDATICDEDRGILTATASAGTIYWYEQESDGNYIATGNNFSTPTLSSTQTYYAEAVNGSCTSITREMATANVYSSPYFTNFEIVDRNTLQLEVDGNSSLYTYELDNNETGYLSGNSLTIDLNSGEYIIRIDDENLCSIDTSFTIDKKPLLEPEVVFSPNGDGNNENWDIDNIEFFPNADIFIYDRYGKKLMTCKGSTFEPWNGEYLGSGMPSGDYWYIIISQDTNDKIKGHFSLKR